MTVIGIIDLDMGNLRSVSNAIAACGHDHVIVRRAKELDEVTHLIVPGVGSYAVAMDHVRRQELRDPIRAFAAAGRPVLGICLGMQLLSTTGEEGGQSAGLDLVPGRVTRFDPLRVPRIPHVGWNELKVSSRHPVLAKVKSGVDFYYVHSYHFVCEPEAVLGVFEYGGAEYVGAVQCKNVLGFQFHPEKSQASGLRVLESFCDWDGRC